MDFVYLQYSVILVRIAHFDFVVEEFTWGSTILAIPLLLKKTSRLQYIHHDTPKH